MPLREDILAPVPGENPSGVNLRYAPVYDKIKEARRQDDDAPQGEWQRERKLADFPQVIKLATEAIATKSKDLQLAAWLTEALLSRDGVEGLKEGLLLIRGLITGFWDTLYPELEDGEAELRAAPVEWVGTRLDELVRKTPITKAGFSFFKFKESRTVPSESDAAENETKLQARTSALAEGKVAPEDFDRAVAGSSRDYYEKLVANFDACLETLEELQPVCEEKFGEFVPSFSKLRAALEEVRHAANGFLQKKREAEGVTADPQTAEQEAEPELEAVAHFAEPAAPADSAAPRPVVRKVTSAEPADREDAISRIVVVARFLRVADSYSPAPYLLLRGLRWGELRASTTLDESLLDPPSTQTRQHLKKLSMESEWAELLESAEVAMGEPCGRGWLDLQRHVSKACEELGDSYGPIGTAIRSELKALLADFPSLLTATLMDDTPAANNDTQIWIQSFLTHSAATPASAPVPHKHDEALGQAEIDSYDLAVAAAKRGRKQEAIEIMSGEVGRQNSGRGRFQRRLQLAQLCVQMGHESISKSILEELARTIDKHMLEDWESSELIAHALSLLLQCMDKGNGDPLETQSLYSRICRLDPMQALGHSR